MFTSYLCTGPPPHSPMRRDALLKLILRNKCQSKFPTSETLKQVKPGSMPKRTITVKKDVNIYNMIMLLNYLSYISHNILCYIQFKLSDVVITQWTFGSICKRLFLIFYHFYGYSPWSALTKILDFEKSSVQTPSHGHITSREVY